MKIASGLFILFVVGLAMTPAFNQGIKTASDSWPAGAPGSFSLSLIPSPVEVVVIFLLVTILIPLLAKVLESA